MFPQVIRLTGERTLPRIWHENYWFRRHEAVYVAIASGLDDAVVLEAGCGEGYGAELLAKQAGRGVALDYDASAIAHLGRAYPAVVGVRGNLVALPYADGTYDGSIDGPFVWADGKLAAVRAWAERHIDSILEARRQFDRPQGGSRVDK